MGKKKKINKALSAAATLLSQAVEKLEQKGARGDRAGTLTYVEYDEALRAALDVEGSLLAATEVDSELRARLAAVRESIEATPSLGTDDAHRGEAAAVVNGRVLGADEGNQAASKTNAVAQSAAVVELQGKLAEKSIQLEILGSSKAELETEVESLEAELSVAVARNGELEASKKRTVMAEADVEVWRNEFYKMVKMKEAAAVAFQAEKAKLERELDEMRAEKTAADARHLELIWSRCT